MEATSAKTSVVFAAAHGWWTMWIGHGPQSWKPFALGDCERRCGSEATLSVIRYRVPFHRVLHEGPIALMKEVMLDMPSFILTVLVLMSWCRNVGSSQELIYPLIVIFEVGRGTGSKAR